MSTTTPNSRLSLTIASAVVVAGALISAGWYAALTLSDIRQELTAIRREVSDVAKDRWTIQDQERWGYMLEKANRERGLVVPLAADVKGHGPS